MNTTAVWGERLNSGIVIKIRMSYKEGETLKHIESMDGVCSKNEPFSKNRWVEEVKNRTMIELTIKQHSKNVPVVIENILYYELRKKEGWNWPDLWHIMDDPSGIQIFSKVTSSSPLQWNTLSTYSNDIQRRGKNAETDQIRGTSRATIKTIGEIAIVKLGRRTLQHPSDTFLCASAWLVVRVEPPWDHLTEYG